MEPLKKINFWRVTTFLKNGRFFEPKVETKSETTSLKQQSPKIFASLE